jgi:hypothetical protein
MLASIDRGFEVQRTKTRWRGQDDDIAVLFQNFCVGIEAYELTIFGNVDFVSMLTL